MSITITFMTPGGEALKVAAEPGERLLDAALDNLIPGIQGQCGGGITCATCHIKVSPSWREKLNPPPEDETCLLGYVDGADQDSRLACQLRLKDTHDGLLVRVATEAAGD